MKKWSKIACISIAFIFLCSLVFMDIKHDYPEKFEIEGFRDVHLFKVSYKSEKGCYVLSDSISKSDIDNKTFFLLGIRFKLKYISKEREHLWDNNHEPDGALGHIDSISNATLVSSSGNNISNDSLLDATAYKYFYSDKVDTWIGHRGNQNGCYEAQTFKTMTDFIQYYNGNYNKPNAVPWIQDYHLFKISNSTASSLIDNNNTKFSFLFTDGKNIENPIVFQSSW